jgi:hypothetical protein
MSEARKIDLFWQVVLIAALLAVVLLFLQNRNLNWSGAGQPQAELNNVYQLERTLAEKNSQLNSLKSAYAKAVVSYREEKLKIAELAISDLEKLERTHKLEAVYSEEYFAEQSEKVSVLKKEIEALESQRCSLVCN